MAIRALNSVSVSGSAASFSAAARVLLRSGCFSPDPEQRASAASAPSSGGTPAVLERLEPLLPEPVEDDGPLFPEGTEELAAAEAGRYGKRLAAMAERAARIKETVAALEEKLTALSRFAPADFDLCELNSMRFTKFRTGSLPQRRFEKLAAADTDGRMIVLPCSEDAGRTYFAVFSPARYAEKTDRLLDDLGFEEADLPADVASVAAECEKIRERIALYKKENEDNEAARREFFDAEGERLGAAVRTLREEAEQEAVRAYASFDEDSFTLSGWVPRDEADRVKAALARAGDFTVKFGAPDDLSGTPPVLLKNPRVFSPFSFFVEMFGTPAYGEVDPTPFVAITYIVLFGVMFGDLGQGLAVSLVGWLMWRIKKMQLGRILIRCGFSSAFFGLIYGSVFGFEHVLDPVYHALFGLEEKPIEVMAPATAGTIIYAAVGVGVALVSVAMLINIFVCARRRDLGGLLFSPNGLPGLVFYGAVAGGMGSLLLFGQSVFSVPYVICLIVLPLILIFLREPLTALVTRSGEKIEWGNYLAQSFFELFESVLSYVTNTMSFLRVGAFVLVHAGMMTVVFTLANMSSGVAWWIIVAVGNVVVTAIEGLLVGIQVLRLEFYEMFSRFFEGGGRPFVPIGKNGAKK